MGLAHLEAGGGAPLGVWWFDDRLRHLYVVDDDAQERGRDHVAKTFDLRLKSRPYTPPADIWTEFRGNLAGASGDDSSWALIDVDDDDRLVVAVGCHEPPKKTQLALAYSLALLGERELYLVLPVGTERPTLSRVPWLDISARVFVHDGDDPYSLREVPIPTPSMVLDQYTDKIVTHVADLGDRAE